MYTDGRFSLVAGIRRRVTLTVAEFSVLAGEVLSMKPGGADVSGFDAPVTMLGNPCLGGPCTGLQWWIYDTFKTAMGMGTSGGGGQPKPAK